MRVIVFIIMIAVVMLMLSSCLPPKASSVKMLANGESMEAIQWSDVGQTQVEVDLGLNLADSPSEAEVEAKLHAGPWWVWPANEEALRLEFGMPLLWDSSIHGLYTTKMDVTGSKLLFTKQRLIQPDQADNGGKWFEYRWSTLGFFMATDDKYEGGSLFFMVLTPYDKGCYIVYFGNKLVNVTTK